jgi:hypothetical protein
MTRCLPSNPFTVLIHAYRNTLAHGGVLGSGVYAGLYYHDGEILRVDIRK